MSKKNDVRSAMPVRFGFVLLRLFPMYVVVLATDALRLANKYAGERVFDWRFLGGHTNPVEASNGIHLDCEADLPQASDLDYAFIVAGDDQNRRLMPQIRNWLVKVAGAGTTLGAIDSGIFALAEARLVRGRKITVHPLAAPAFQEQFPEIAIDPDSVCIDRSLITCAGGISTVELMLRLIEQHCGPAISRYVANDMVLADRDFPSKPPAQRGDGISGDLDGLMRRMQRNIEKPISLSDLSAEARLSARQIARIFQRGVGESPMAYYRKLRLNHAKQLLFQSELSVSEIAVASGFQSVSAFSRCFAAEFGHAPSQLLKNLREAGNAEAVPTHHLNKRLIPRNA
jgi:AraC family carnitine catabolism transcriptional activator